jgi:sterol desaturase/sphingolipid hydroxylase (fatty acid hydroxylase superfamily)
MFYVYLTFLFTFISSSSICFVNDIFLNKNENDYIINQYRDILPTVAINIFLYIPIISLLAESNLDLLYSWQEYNLFRSIYSIFFAYLLIDVFFFTCHRIMHIPIIYKWSHKIHHKYKYTVGMEALYLHWFDLYFGNIIPLNLPIILMPKLHIITWMMYMIIIISATVLSAHGLIIQNDHDIHHIYFNYNYGTGMYMDHIFNTARKTIPCNLQRINKLKDKFKQKLN